MYSAIAVRPAANRGLEVFLMLIISVVAGGENAVKFIVMVDGKCLRRWMRVNQ